MEDTGLRESLSRSMRLTKGHLSRVFVIYLLYLFIEFFCLAAVGGLMGGHAVHTFARQAEGVVALALLCLTSPVLTIALAVMYYDERVRKDAYDIQAMMDAQVEGSGRAAAVAAG